MLFTSGAEYTAYIFPESKPKISAESVPAGISGTLMLSTSSEEVVVIVACTSYSSAKEQTVKESAAAKARNTMSTFFIFFFLHVLFCKYRSNAGVPVIGTVHNQECVIGFAILRNQSLRFYLPVR